MTKKKPYTIIPREPMLVETAPTAWTREQRAPDALRRTVPRDIGEKITYFLGILPPKKDDPEEENNTSRTGAK